MNPIIQSWRRGLMNSLSAMGPPRAARTRHSTSYRGVPFQAAVEQRLRWSSEMAVPGGHGHGPTIESAQMTQPTAPSARAGTLDQVRRDGAAIALFPGDE